MKIRSLAAVLKKAQARAELVRGRTLHAPRTAWTPTVKAAERSTEVAQQAHHVALQFGLSRATRADRISGLSLDYLAPKQLEGIATPDQIRLFVSETLVHREEVVSIGRLRGQRWLEHDIEGGTSKFNPKIAAGLAKPTRDRTVLNAIKAHNQAEHHVHWASPTASLDDLAESATDIVSAWRQERGYKKAWSFSDIAAHLAMESERGRLTPLQVRALKDAVRFQKQYEALRR